MPNIDPTTQYVYYAVAIRNRGSCEIKWWTEREARDTTSQFHAQIQRPEFIDTMEFDVVVQLGWDQEQIRKAVVTEYARLLAGGGDPIELLRECQHVMNMLPRNREVTSVKYRDTYQLAAEIDRFFRNYGPN